MATTHEIQPGRRIDLARRTGAPGFRTMTDASASTDRRPGIAGWFAEHPPGRAGG